MDELATARSREAALHAENARLVAAKAEQERAFEAMHQVALAVGGELDLDRVVEVAVASCGSLFGDRQVAAQIALYDPAGDCLRIARDGLGLVRAGTPLRGGANWTAFRGRQPVTVNDYDAWPEHLDAMVDLGYRAVLAVPLAAGDRPLGTLAFVAMEPYDFTEPDVSTAVMLAAQVGPALQAARTHADLRRRTAKQALVAEAARAAVGRVPEQALAKMTVDGLLDVLEAQTAAVLERHGDRFRLVCAAGGDTDDARALERVVGSGTGEAGTLFEAGTATFLNIEYAGHAGVLCVAAPRRPLGEPELHFLGAVGGLLTEVSRAAAAEKAARASDARFRLAADSSTDGIWYLDLEGRTTYANRRLAEILRTDVETLMRSSAWDFTPPEEMEAARRRFDGRLQGSSGRSERVYVGRDGSRVTTSVTSSPIRDTSGTVIGVGVVMTDLTEIRAAERAIQESLEKSRFLAAMSHELRTPLNSILGFSQLLDDESFGPLSERQRRYLGHIRTQGEHLLALISDVLDVSRVAAGKLEMAAEPVDLTAVAADVVGRMRPLAEARGHTLTCDGTQAAVACGDRLRIAQALMNLLSNAIKFTPPGGRIEVSAGAGSGSCFVAVTDNGPGMTAQEQEIAFDEFTTLAAGRRGEGSGLGLSLTRRLVQAMGGRVVMRSAPGQGSTFTIELPAASPA